MVTHVHPRGKPGRPWRVPREVGHEAIAQTDAVPLVVVVQELDLHAGHVHARGTLPLAPFAPDAEIHGLVHRVGGERVGAELAGDGQAE